MKLFILTLLAVTVAYAATINEEDKVELVPIDQLGDDALDYFPDHGAEEELLMDAMSRFKKRRPHRPRRPHKKKKKPRRRPNRRLRVQLKAFRRSNGAVSYKYYILQGRNIRHYRVNFRRRQQSKALRSVQRETRNCIIRRYTRKCFFLPLFVKGFCTTLVAKKCSGSFKSFEFANPKTRGKNKVKPGKKKKKPRPPVGKPPEQPEITPGFTIEPNVTIPDFTPSPILE